ncbi:MAG: hypothetical protein M3Y41_07090 [Pseudomonadota bacterium]|nr:hypothetical protein [Pseudomonadota bacterium]
MPRSRGVIVLVEIEVNTLNADGLCRADANLVLDHESGKLLAVDQDKPM